MVEKLLAAAGLVVCIALLLHMVLPVARRRRVALWLHDAGASVRSLRHWGRNRREAARQADETIRRARGEGHWEGNVFRPKSFKRPPKE